MEGVDVSLASVRLTQKYIQITTAKQHLLHPVCVFVYVCVCGKESVNEHLKRRKAYSEHCREESLIQLICFLGNFGVFTEAIGR